MFFSSHRCLIHWSLSVLTANMLYRHWYQNYLVLVFVPLNTLFYFYCFCAGLHFSWNFDTATFVKVMLVCQRFWLFVQKEIVTLIDCSCLYTLGNFGKDLFIYASFNLKYFSYPTMYHLNYKIEKKSNETLMFLVNKIIVLFIKFCLYVSFLKVLFGSF